MKHALLKTKSRLIMSLMIVIMSVVYTSCDDTETTDSTKFTIFYSGMTDIGPSMSGRISSPTYKGNTPSDFAITKVTLKGEAYSGDCFTIDPNDGFISINSTKDMQVGLYKLSISCISGGNYYEFKDIVEINFLKAVPDGITVEPNKLQVKYNDIIDDFEGYTVEAYENFKKGCCIGATALNTNSKAGCENEFALFVKLKENSYKYLPSLTKYIKFEKSDKIVYDLTELGEFLENFKEDIESIEIYANKFSVEVKTGKLNCEVKDIFY